MPSTMRYGGSFFKNNFVFHFWYCGYFDCLFPLSTQYYSTQYNFEINRFEIFGALFEMYYIWINWCFALSHMPLFHLKVIHNFTQFKWLSCNVPKTCQYAFFIQCFNEISAQNQCDCPLPYGFHKLQHLVSILSNICYDKIFHSILDQPHIFHKVNISYAGISTSSFHSFSNHGQILKNMILRTNTVTYII